MRNGCPSYQGFLVIALLTFLKKVLDFTIPDIIVYFSRVVEIHVSHSHELSEIISFFTHRSSVVSLRAVQKCAKRKSANPVYWQLTSECSGHFLQSVARSNLLSLLVYCIQVCYIY